MCDDYGMAKSNSITEGAAAEAYTLRTIGWLFLAATVFVAFALVVRENRLADDFQNMQYPVIFGGSLVMIGLVVRSLCTNVANIVRLMSFDLRRKYATEED